MMASRRALLAPILLLIISALCMLPIAAAKEAVYLKAYGLDGVNRELDVSRTPALYTSDFADCLGGESLFNVTKFDAAYYADNLTVLFHFDGTTNVRQESLMLNIAVDAYGENKFNMTYDPCHANIDSMCPLNASNPITAFVVVPVAPSMVSGIPAIALSIPDLEGRARIRIFANSTQTEIGCFQAAMTNGNSLSQPHLVGGFIGFCVFLAVLASFATAIYGVSIPHTRTHYAHSLSVLVVFETFQSIFFSGALSVNWPSVLPAWWSNFAWTAGMFANNAMLRSISSFTGISGNFIEVGSPGSVTGNNDNSLLQQIYGSAAPTTPIRPRSQGNLFRERVAYNASNPYDYTWHGHPRTPGMPMPGTWPGLAGTLSMVNIPISEAFVICLIWLLAILVVVALSITFTKVIIDLLVKIRWIKRDGFDYFRSHLPGYLAVGLLRTLFIAFFTIMTMAMYQFSLRGSLGPTTIASVAWVIFFVGIGGTVIYACYFRLRQGKFECGRDAVLVKQGKLFKKLPFVKITRASQIGEEEKAETAPVFGSMPIFRINYTDDNPKRTTVHEDGKYIRCFGWLSARYRRTRWRFFAVYLGYQFIRACFIGGAARMPLVQVYGLLAFEVIAFLAFIKINPFEGSRNTTVAVWLLSISKIVTTGLSVAFLPEFNLNRIIATVVGIIIVVVQGFLAAAVLVLIVLGVISSWMSLSRNREEFSENLDPIRIKYFGHLETTAKDLPPPPKRVEPPEPIEPSFVVTSVRRAPKIEDEVFGITDEESKSGDGTNRESQGRSRTNSDGSYYSTSEIPRAARVHRMTWSTKDFVRQGTH